MKGKRAGEREGRPQLPKAKGIFKKQNFFFF